MNQTKIFSILCAALFSLQGFAADLPGITKLFKSTFWTSHYQENLCGQNIENLVKKAMAARLDLSGAQIVQITDSSGWMLMLVNALAAREAGKAIVPAQVNPARHPGERNWNFHVVLLVEGQIIDYDFTNQPQVFSMRDYLHYMFIPTTKYADKAYKTSKMKGYKLRYYPAEDYILRLNQRLPTKDIAKEVYLRDFLPAFFQ